MGFLRKTWNAVTLRDQPPGRLRKLVFVVIALLLGLGAYELVSHGPGVRDEPDRYFLVSPSEVLSEEVSLNDSSVEVLVDRCSTFEGPVAVSFDTTWLYYPSVEEPNTQPGVNGFSDQGLYVLPGGSACEPSTEGQIVSALPLGDIELRNSSGDQTARGGGMWPGYWSMSSRLVISECLVAQEDNSTRSGMRCIETGDVLGTESWYTDPFLVVEESAEHGS